MAKVCSVVNNKGGVGKSTSVACFGEILALIGKKVLLVDTDPQGNLSMLYGGYYDDSKDEGEPQYKNIAELYKHRYRTAKEMNEIIYPTQIPNLFLLPATPRHNNTETNIMLNRTGNNSVILKKALATIKDDYDYIIIDNAPANNILTVNNLVASDLVIVPVRTEGFSYQGLQVILNALNSIKDEYELDNLEFGGVFMTQTENNTNVYKSLCEAYGEELADKFLKTPIRKDTLIQQCETEMKPILSYASKSNAVLDYFKLILELGILDEESSKLLKTAFVEEENVVPEIK